jgi:hypothetical protein
MDEGLIRLRSTQHTFFIPIFKRLLRLGLSGHQALASSLPLLIKSEYFFKRYLVIFLVVLFTARLVGLLLETHFLAYELANSTSCLIISFISLYESGKGILSITSRVGFHCLQVILNEWFATRKGSRLLVGLHRSLISTKNVELGRLR